MTACAGLLAACLAAGPARELARAPAGSPVALALAKRVSVAYSETPFGEAVLHLAKRAGFKLAIDGDIVEEGRTNAPITFAIDDVPAGEVLRWMMWKADLACDVGREVVTVSTQSAIMCRRAELRIYSVSDLADGRDNPELPGHDTTTWPHACPPRPGLVLIAEDMDTAFCNTPESIAELVMSTVRPACWDTSLGTSVEVRGNRLIVTATPEMHEEIVQVLERVRLAERRMVTIRVRALRAPAALADRVLDGASPAGILSPEAVARLDALVRAEPKRTLASARLACLNGRRVRSSSGRQTNYVDSHTVSNGKRDPAVRTVVSGLRADVFAVASDDMRSVLLELRLTYSPHAGRELRDVRSAGKPESGAPPLSPQSGPIKECALPLAKVRTSVRLPSGGTMLLSVPALPGGEPDAAEGGDDEEIVFLVTATAVTF
jgi:hypothetical protein